MAFIVKGDGAAVTYHSELANAGPDASAAHARQKDAYRLALLGSRDMRRLWADFEAECPALARLVKADVETERRKGAEVSRRLDERLREAEVLVTKARKPKKAKVRRASVTKRARAESDPELAAVLTITDNWQREEAYSDLMRRRG